MLFEKISTIDIPDTAKWAFTTRRVNRDDAVCLTTGFAEARPGDLVLARVEKIGSHKRIQLTSGRPSELYQGDIVVLACGARYAPDQYEGLAMIDPAGADMLAGGGVIGQMRAANERMSGPTRVMPIGLLSNRDGQPLNIADYSLPTLPNLAKPRNLTVIAAVGASMNAGKTTAVASLAHGLTRAGYKVAALKVTGTGAYGDYNAYLDAGAGYVADFVDAGMASTYLEPVSRVVEGMETLLGHAAENGCNVALVELADGIFQGETSAILERKEFSMGVDGVMFAAPCAASTAGGCAVLRSMEIEPAVVTGMVSRSPLATSEAETATGVSVTTREALRDPVHAGALLARIRSQKSAAIEKSLRAA
jgi:hypothetical protein